MEDYIKALKTNKKLLVSTILSAVAFLVLIIGATYAYFGVDQINDTSASTITASTKGVGNVSLVDGNNLRLDITADDMAIPQDNITFWATTDGTPSLTENEVVIASANVIGTGTMYCDYTMNITKTSTTPEKDLFTAFSGWTDPGKESDQIVLKVDNGESIQIYDFNDSELSFPVSYTGRLTNLTEEAVRNLKASFKIVNLKDVDQTVISGKNVQFAFTFTDFQCELQGDSAETPAPSNPYIGMTGKNLATTLISKAGMWQSGLEDDGYRFTGTGIMCSYDGGTHEISIPEGSTCPTLYNYTVTDTSTGYVYNQEYDTKCPENEGIFEYSCTEEFAPTQTDNTAPNNFICFGTTDLAECKANESKYLYRIIGTFEDSSNNQHVKLIKYYSLPSTQNWNSTADDTNWGDSSLKVGLNGSYYLTNPTFNYLQNNEWSSKINDWTWTAVNTQTHTASGTFYNHMIAKDVYLHEMNKSKNTAKCYGYNGSPEIVEIPCTSGTWTTPSAKIGLMYTSDYALSLGRNALSVSNDNMLKTSWMNISNNKYGSEVDYYSDGEWTIARNGLNLGGSSSWDAWSVDNLGSLTFGVINFEMSARPVFYLTSDTKYASGSGDYTDPIIIN